MKKSLTLTPAEVENLKTFVEEVQTLIENDEDGVLVDLYASAEIAAEILGIEKEEQDDTEA